MNNVLYDTKTNEVVILKDFSYKESGMGFGKLHNPNPSESFLIIDIKYITWLENFIDQNGRFNACNYKSDLYICNLKDFTIKLIGCFISSYSIEDDIIRFVIESDYHIVDNKVDNQFKQLYRENVLFKLGIN
jgi:hypothetical protein